MIYQIKVQLNNIRPAIWRRFQVQDNITLYNLHQILQIVMGWEDYHLHEFEIQEQRYSAPMDEADGFSFFEDDTAVDERKVKLSQVVRKEKAEFIYTYDFGDDWRHKLLVEKIMPAQKEQQYPVCVKGKRACPPEDCGGPWGYSDLLEAVDHPDDPNSEELLEWIGEFDSEEFDLDEINSCLIELK